MAFRCEPYLDVYKDSGLACSVVVTGANMHQKHPSSDLVHGQEREVYFESACAS